MGGIGGEQFERVYALHFDAVYGYLRCMLRDAQEAEDATQQVFLKVYEALPRHRPGDRPLIAWLLRIARNHAIDRLRARRALGEPCQQEGASPAWADPDERLRSLVDELPLLQRQVVFLRYTLCFTPPEVAGILGRSHGAVRQAEYRALRVLERRLGGPREELALAG